MRSETGRAIGILVVVLTATVAVESVIVLRLSRRVGELENREAAADVERATPLAIAREVDQIRIRLDDVSKAIDSVDRETGQQLEAIERVAHQAMALSVEGGGTAGGTAATGAAPAMSPEKFEAAVAKAVEAKLEKELPKGDSGEWKPSMQQFAEKLELTEYQTTRVEKALDDAKAEMYALAALKRDDGTSMLDDLVTAVRDPEDPEKAMKGWFMRLFSEKIPGREETYIAELLRTKERTKDSIASMLEPAQAKRMLRMNIDYLGVKTSYDPFQEYLQDSMR